MSKLSGPRRAPRAGGPARQLVVLFHGVGADGQDLISLAPPLAERLPHAAFVAPDAPDPCDMAPFGRQWFSLLDRRTDVLLAGVRAVAPTIDAFLDDELAEHGLTDADLGVISFSQGTMTALHVMLRRPRPPAALVCFSGALLAPELLPKEIRSRPPVYLVHGELDQVVPCQAMPAAVAALQAADVPVRWSVCHGLGHGIDPAMLAPAAAFLETGFATARQTR